MSLNSLLTLFPSSVLPGLLFGPLVLYYVPPLPHLPSSPMYVILPVSLLKYLGGQWGWGRELMAVGKFICEIPCW